jgi:hypothetical protein
MERLPISRPIALRTSHGLISPRAGFASIAYGATAARKLFSPGDEDVAIPRGKTK